MRQWVWVAIAAVFILLFLAWLERRVQINSPYKQVQRELMRLQRLGEPTKLSDLLPPVPANQDGTLLYKLAITQLDAAKTNSALQTLRKALNYPHMRMTDWDIENPTGVTFPHFAKFREFARLLFAEGKWWKRQGDIDGAIESHLTVLKLVQRMGDEPSLVGFLVQGAIFSFAVSELQRLLSDVDPSPKSYQTLLSGFMSWDIDRDFVRAIQFERVFVIVVCDWMGKKASRKMLSGSLGMSSLGSPQIVNLAVWLKGKSELIAHNELNLLKHYEALLKLAREGVPYNREKLKQLDKQWGQRIDRPAKGLKLGNVQVVWDENFIAKFFIFYSMLFDKVASFHALQRLTQVAIALRLYRRDRGHYPETLQELVPKYLPSVPVDPFDGKPLRYKRLKQGFKVWSVGEDLKDDGGVERTPRWVKGDIVWEALR